MGEEPDLGKLPSLIPEIYYDLIARVPAGAVLFLAIVLIGGQYSPDQLKSENFGSATVILVLLLLFSYALGILITPLASAFHRRYREAVWRQALCEHNYCSLVQLLEARFHLGLPKDQSGQVQLNSFQRKHYDRLDRLMHDYLKGADPQAKVILPKMRAEASLCDQLFVAFSCIALVGAYSLLVRHTSLGEHFGASLLVVGGLALAALGARHRNKRLIHRQFSFLTLVVGQNGDMAANNRMNMPAGGGLEAD